MSQKMLKYRWWALAGVVFFIVVGGDWFLGFQKRQAALARQQAEERKARDEAQTLVGEARKQEAVARLCLAGLKAAKEKRRHAARVFYAEAAQRGRNWSLPYLALAQWKGQSGDAAGAREMLQLAAPDPLGSGALSRLWQEDPATAVHTEAVYRAAGAGEWATVEEHARATLERRPNMDGVLVRRFHALLALDRLTDAQELAVELRRRVPLYLLWEGLAEYLHTRYAPEPTDRIQVKSWHIDDVFCLAPRPDNRVYATARQQGIWLLAPDGGGRQLPGTAEADGCSLWPERILLLPSGEVWMVGCNSGEITLSRWQNGQIFNETPVPPVPEYAFFTQLLLHGGDVWGVYEGVVFQQHGTDWLAYVPARGGQELVLPPGVWSSARRHWNMAWQQDAKVHTQFANEDKAYQRDLSRYWQQVAPSSGLDAVNESNQELGLWRDSEGRLWYGVQRWDGKMWRPAEAEVRDKLRRAWKLTDGRWWTPPEAWRREWAYVATHFRGATDEGPLLRGRTLDASGRLWVGLWNAGVMVYDGHRWLAIPLKQVPAGVRTLVPTPDGAVWAATEEGVVRIVATVAEAE